MSETKEKKSQIFSATIENNPWFLQTRVYCGKMQSKSRLGIFPHTWAYSNIFRHNQAYPGIIQACSGIFRTLHNPDIFRNLVEPRIQNLGSVAYSEPDAYSEPWHIQNPGVFRTLAYSEPCQTSTMQHFAKIVNGYNYFRNISISCSLLYEKNVNFYHAGLIFTPELFDVK